MFPYFVLGLAVVVALFLIGRWFVKADPRTVAKAARWLLFGLGLALVVFLVLARRWFLALWLAVMLLPLVLRSRGLWQRMKSARGPTPGGGSEIMTRFLKMTLDHDSGVMSGEVREGAFAGARLEDLELVQLIELWRECQLQDRQSAAVLEAYLDRTQGEAWREAAGAGPAPGGAGAGAGAGAGGGPGPGGGMSREEALDILGLKPGASAREIREAHRRLMQKVHPDHGGSNYLAAKINQAKELLLRE
ncbi:MAG: DnaJ domain-containing protein [Rhodospirillales bacterium]|nr:DnaJ domain-containing protein [Rhodospirillales bacterium]